MLARSWVFVEVENALGDKVSSACCHRSRVRLSAIALVSSCNRWVEEVGGGCVDGGS